MLKIRPDGKLSSPKSQKTCPEMKPRRRATSRPANGEKTMMVIIKYGTDNEGRLALGGKIGAILTKPPMLLKRKQSPKRPSPKRINSDKPVVTFKPTHPFFLGKAAECANGRDQEPEKCTKESIARKEASKGDSPRKITFVNKVIRRDSPKGLSPSGDQASSLKLRKVSSLAGAVEALWPPQGMCHIKGSAEQLETSIPLATPVLYRSRKLKDASVQVQEVEDVLHTYNALINHQRSRLAEPTSYMRQVRKPTRKVITGRELQRCVSRIIENDPSMVKQPQSPGWHDHTPHCAITSLYARIAESTTAFDRFECEPQDWVHKYAPQTAEDVLQPGREAIILRDWLKGLTINAVGNRGFESTGTREPSLNSKRNGGNSKRKRRKRAEGLDDFLISSDEEANQMNAVSTDDSPELVALGQSSLKKSVIRAVDMMKKPGGLERAANAVVISGPHGCGKTAAVHAVAQELGFEIFEINPASRRSGKDILDKVGDMTKNHLVSHQQDEENKHLVDDNENMIRVTEALRKDIESGRQGTMNAFFRPKPETVGKTTSKPRGRPPKKGTAVNKPINKNARAQKQSLILLEEVDILFEDDRQFWATTVDLILRSRRPVVMTCTNERLIPLEDMVLFAILRFSPPPKTLATDYLMLVACNEGHLLLRDSVHALYRSKNKDLRASITELNFFCQMAVGDEKGGLEWLLIRPTLKESENGFGEKLRVISEDTYPHGLGWLSHDHSRSHVDGGFETDSELLAEAWNGWGVDLAEGDDFMSVREPVHDDMSSVQGNLIMLRNLEHAHDALSTADICSPIGIRRPEAISLDPAGPDILEKAHLNYVEGATLLLADPRTDETGMSTSLAVAIRVLARRLTPQYTPLKPSDVTRHLLALLEEHQAPPPTTITSVQRALLPLTPVNVMSSLTVPVSTLVADVAPYVRSITSYDLRLEEQRRKLDDLLSIQIGAGDARNAKRVRTTRASRAALEGGAKATTRRERWFPNTLDFMAVSETGGKTWDEVTLNRMRDKPVLDEGLVAETQLSTGSAKKRNSGWRLL